MERKMVKALIPRSIEETGYSYPEKLANGKHQTYKDRYQVDRQSCKQASSSI